MFDKFEVVAVGAAKRRTALLCIPLPECISFLAIAISKPNERKREREGGRGREIEKEMESEKQRTGLRNGRSKAKKRC